MDKLTLRSDLDARFSALDSEMQSWIGHWKDVSENVLPRTSRFLSNERNNGSKRNQKIYNEAATFAVRASARGMMSKITNPARPWLRFRTPSDELNKRTDVSIWLDELARRVLEVFLRSNIYTVWGMGYQDLLAYGTAPYVLEKDIETVVRAELLPVGSYRLAMSGSHRIDTCYREFQMTMRQVIQRFGLKNCSPTIQAAHDGANSAVLETYVDIRHCVEPNEDYDSRSALNTKMKYRSVYYEKSAPSGDFLSISGFRTFPVIAPRWEVAEGDVYGSSPVMDVLGTIKGLQILEKRRLQLLDKVITPPLNVPIELRKREINQLSGGLNFVANMGQQKIEAMHEIKNAPLAEVKEAIAEYTARIRKGVFEDVFMAMNGIETSGRTAEEIRARVEEKVMSIGPILLRLNDESLDPAIERTLEIMAGPEFKGLLPPAPKAIRGMPLSVEYVSDLAQSMKLAGLASVERLVLFAVNTFGQVVPQTLDKIDADEVMDIYADLSGAPAKMMRDAKTVAGIRESRAAQQQVVEQEALAAQKAETMERLGNTQTGPMPGDNALMAALSGGE